MTVIIWHLLHIQLVDVVIIKNAHLIILLTP